MIIGLGVDIAEVSRIREAIERHGDRFLNRVFTALEIAYCQRHKNQYERFAARFAAKEAAMKALGTGWRNGVVWHDFEVSNNSNGRPDLRISGKAHEFYCAMGGRNVVLSLTHTAEYALAEVIIED
jgi:holo-[acyl-carrier protein] synthase